MMVEICRMGLIRVGTKNVSTLRNYEQTNKNQQ